MACTCLLPACADCFPTPGLITQHREYEVEPDLATSQSSSGIMCPKACTCFLPHCPNCSMMNSGNTGSRKRVQRKSGVKRPLVRELEDDSGSDSDPSGMAFVRNLVHEGHARRWQSLSAFAVLQSRWDFWGLWDGCGALTLAFSCLGHVVGPSADILRNESVPRLLVDFEDVDDVSFVWWLLRKFRPRHVHVGPPCTFWNKLGRLTAVRTPREWDQLRNRAKMHLKLAVRVMRWQHDSGQSGSLEQPPGCISWRLRCLTSLLELPGWCIYTWPSCAYGHRDPGSNLPYLKMQGFASNIDLSSMEVCCSCSPGSHQSVQGAVQGGPRHGERRSTVSGEYPAAMCNRLAAIIGDTWATEGH